MNKSLLVVVVVGLCQMQIVPAFWFKDVFKPVISKLCKPLSCKMDCPSGFVQDKKGCPNCQCTGKKKVHGRYPHVVETTSGPVIGKTIELPTTKLVDEYLGIKYAQAKRFEKPQPPQSWTTPFYASSFGKSCPQRQFNISGEIVPQTDEDCLFINVFVPHRKLAEGELFYVMHWIHGGGYTSNSGDQVGAEVLASEGDVIVVTSNYRVGALGYLATGDTDLPGNYGMLDQQAALKWTQDNILNFGGDPTTVTVFGESAGAFSVSLQILSPLANNLFHRAIVESGAALGMPPFLPIEQAQKNARKFAEKVGCDMETLKSCLEEKTIKEIISAQSKTLSITDLTYLAWAPVVDGEFLLDSPENLLKEGKFIQRNVLMGVNNDEAGLILALIPDIIVGNGIQRWMFELVAKIGKWTENQTPENLNSIIFQYTNWTDPQDPISNRRNLMDLISDPVFKAPTIKTVQTYADKNVTTYLYQLEHGPDYDYIYGQMPDWMEAYHYADITYVFGIPLLQDKATSDDSEVRFSMEIMKMWSNFAKTGNPTPDDALLKWPKYNSDTQKYMALKPDAFEIKSKLRAEYVEFWNNYIPSQTCVITSCVNQPDGRKFPYPGDCTKYYVCKDEKGIQKSCLFGSYFSIFTHKCTIPALSGCKMEAKRR